MTAVESVRPGTADLAELLSSFGGTGPTDPDWLVEARRSAADWATRRGLPTRKDEDWKYTPLSPLLGAASRAAVGVVPGVAATAKDVEPYTLAGSLARLIFVNGVFVPGLSVLGTTTPGLTVGCLAADITKGVAGVEGLFAPSTGEFSNSFEALNTAGAEDGAVIRVETGERIEGRIELLFWSDGNGSSPVSQPRSLIVAGPGSHLSVVETYAGRAGTSGVTNAVTRVMVGEGATVDHYKIQDEPDTGFHLALLDVAQAADSRFHSLSIALGSRIARHEARVRLNGERAQATINGLYLPGGDRHHDNPVLVVHSAPNCTSRQLYKGIATGHGHGVFNGHLVVHPGADGADASQTNKNLLLSDQAEIDTRPRLEILTDDVKCTHGAAVGALDPDAVFYLRSRGISDADAKSILTAAFAREIVDLVSDDTLRARIEALVNLRLATDPHLVDQP